MVMYKCPQCNKRFSVPHYVVDYICNCDKVSKFERVNIEGNYMFRGMDQYPFKQSKISRQRNRTFIDFPLKKYVELR